MAASARSSRWSASSGRPLADESAGKDAVEGHDHHRHDDPRTDHRDDLADATASGHLRGGEVDRLRGRLLLRFVVFLLLLLLLLLRHVISFGRPSRRLESHAARVKVMTLRALVMRLDGQHPHPLAARGADRTFSVRVDRACRRDAAGRRVLPGADSAQAVRLVLPLVVHRPPRLRPRRAADQAARASGPPREARVCRYHLKNSRTRRLRRGATSAWRAAPRDPTACCRGRAADPGRG